MRIHHIVSIIGPVSAPIVAAAVLGGCGSGADQPRVASLPAHGTVASSATSAPSTPAGGATDDSGSTTGRPQFRLDDTEARRTALVNAYSSCLIDHGATKVDNSGRAVAVPAGKGGVPFIQVADPVPPAAKAACLHLLPVPPPETDAATNPNFHAQSLAYVGCLKDHGVWVRLLNNHDLDWTYLSGHPVPDDEAKVEQSCLMQAFGGS